MHMLISGSDLTTRSGLRLSRSPGESSEVDAIVEFEVEGIGSVEAAMKRVGGRATTAVRALCDGAGAATELDRAATQLPAERMGPRLQERLIANIAEVHVLAQICTAD